QWRAAGLAAAGAPIPTDLVTCCISLFLQSRRRIMARCEVCGNDYEKAFEVVLEGKHHTFDSFECAIHALAPKCAHCDCHVIGHGVEENGKIYCCTHCADMSSSKKAQHQHA